METQTLEDKVINTEASSTSMVEQTKNEVQASVQESKVGDSADPEFTRARVEGLGNKIRLVDSDEETGLDLFCYTRCTNEDDDFLKQCRGVVFNGDKLVLKAFSYTPEYNHTELATLEHVMKDFSDWSFYDAYEGALLRLFYFSGRWFLSTHRKLNAFRSKWASRDSFGTLFKRALEAEEKSNNKFAQRLDKGENILDRFQATLDQDKQYMFLLINSAENRIVCHAPDRPTLYHVGTFVNDELDMTVDSGLPYPRKMSFLNIDELLHYIESNIDPRFMQGAVCFGPNNQQIKILHRDYQELFRARGNEPSIKFRYLQVRMNKKMTDMLYYLYPDMTETFDEYENTIYEIARSIHNSYIQRFIKKRYVTVPREEFQVVRECHDWHLSDRENNRISLDRVIRTLNKQPPTNLNHMIRRFKTEEAKKQETKPRSYKGSPALTGLTPGSSPALDPLVLKTKKLSTLNLPPPILDKK